jgi:hypothetical protein
LPDFPFDVGDRFDFADPTATMSWAALSVSLTMVLLLLLSMMSTWCNAQDFEPANYGRSCTPTSNPFLDNEVIKKKRKEKKKEIVIVFKMLIYFFVIFSLRRNLIRLQMVVALACICQRAHVRRNKKNKNKKRKEKNKNYSFLCFPL